VPRSALKFSFEVFNRVSYKVNFQRAFATGELKDNSFTGIRHFKEKVNRLQRDLAGHRMTGILVKLITVLASKIALLGNYQGTGLSPSIHILP
jgi:hypothetical protein